MLVINRIKKLKTNSKLLLLISVILVSVSIISFVQSASFEIADQPEPTVSNTSVTPGTEDRGSSVAISSKVIDVSGVTYVKIQIKNGFDTIVANIDLYDDGTHSDSAAGDNIYGNTWTIPISFSAGNYKIFITASDTLGNVYQTGITTPFGEAGPRSEETNFNVTVPVITCPDGSCDVAGGECSSCPIDCTVADCCGTDISCNAVVGEDCSSCSTDCGCVAPNICCSGTCQLPACVNNSDCNDGDSCTTDTCNNSGTCSATCSNPSVGCIDDDGCCPAGCDSTNDNNCSAICVTDGSCDSNCPIGCTVAEDPDCGCQDDNGCCGIGCDSTNDNNCCTNTCATDAGCSAIVLSNANITTDVCCGVGESCYECDTSYCWNGSSCIEDYDPIPNPVVGSAPNPIGISTTVAIDDTVYFDGSSYSLDPYGTIVKYEWDFENDGAYDWTHTTTGITTHIYTTAGSYIAKLRVTDDCGVTATDTVNITVNPPGLAASILSPTDGDAFSEGDTITFWGSATGGISPYTFSWTSSINGPIGSSQVFNKNDLSVGDHTITLKVIDNASTENTISINVYIPPNSFTWQNVSGQNWMTNIKDQGACGSCWAFATVGSVEAKYQIEQNNSTSGINLSEQYIVSGCCSAGDCSGGTVLAFSCVQNIGIAEKNCYNYLGSNSSCPVACDDTSPIDLWKINSWDPIIPQPQGDKADIQRALIQHGPLFVGIAVDPSGGYFGVTGTVDENSCAVYTCGTTPNHAVVLVGYDNTNQYWIIKNSWGVISLDICDNGYASMDYGTCLIGSNMYGFYSEGVLSP